jgi:hypothetical protein
LPQQFIQERPLCSLQEPVSPRDALPEDNLVFFLLDLIPHMDLTLFHQYYAQEQGLDRFLETQHGGMKASSEAETLHRLMRFVPGKTTGMSLSFLPIITIKRTQSRCRGYLIDNSRCFIIDAFIRLRDDLRFRAKRSAPGAAHHD